MNTYKKRPFGQSLKALWKETGKHKNLYLVGLLLGILDAACQSALPLFFRYALNKLEVGVTDYYNEILIPCGIAAIIVILIFLPAAFGFHYLSILATSKIMRDLRIKLYTHIQSMSSDFFQKNKVGEITSRMNEDLNVLEAGFNRNMGIVWASFVFLLSFTSIVIINWKLSLLMLLLLTIPAIASKYYLPKIRELSRSLRDATGEVSATLTEYISINVLIKTMAREDYGIERISSASDNVLQKALIFLWRQFVYSDIMQVFVRFLSPIIILIVGGYMVSQKTLRLGDLAAFWGYWMIINSLITSILDSITTIFSTLASGDRIIDYLELTPSIQDNDNSSELTAPKGELVFKNINFCYPTDSEEKVLDNLSFTIPAGKLFALVGPSGAGKSTVLQLIQRFYDPLEGSILIDGIDIKDIKQSSLRDNIGFVMQESIFFAGTIASNMKLANQDATEEEMRKALKNANALEFVEELPLHLHTVLGERGARLSGGQKQRLAIARVFLKNPPILLFDEATSALDSLSEKAVQEAMTRLMKNRTTVVVAHRLSTIQNADKIIVLDKGKISFMDTHKELVLKSSLYNELATHQGLV